MLWSATKIKQKFKLLWIPRNSRRNLINSREFPPWIQHITIPGNSRKGFPSGLGHSRPIQHHRSPRLLAQWYACAYMYAIPVRTCKHKCNMYCVPVLHTCMRIHVRTCKQTGDMYCIPVLPEEGREGKEREKNSSPQCYSRSIASVKMIPHYQIIKISVTVKIAQVVKLHCYQVDNLGCNRARAEWYLPVLKPLLLSLLYKSIVVV